MWLPTSLQQMLIYCFTYHINDLKLYKHYPLCTYYSLSPNLVLLNLLINKCFSRFDLATVCSFSTNIYSEVFPIPLHLRCLLIRGNFQCKRLCLGIARSVLSNTKYCFMIGNHGYNIIILLTVFSF